MMPGVTRIILLELTVLGVAAALVVAAGLVAAWATRRVCAAAER